ncbi:MAG: substrate-binding domain-containing protein [Solimonas sp.]
MLIAPPAVIDAVLATGRAVEARQAMGGVGVGVVVRHGDAKPAIATVDDIRAAVLKADAVVYNRASTGTYVEQLFERLEIAPAIAGKVQRYDDGDAVMAHLIDAPQGTLGFGANTEIRLYADRGVDYVGPLPAAIQNVTRYEAIRFKASGEAAAALLRFLDTPQALDAFVRSGVERP